MITSIINNFLERKGTLKSTVELHGIISGGRRNWGYSQGSHLNSSKEHRREVGIEREVVRR